AAARVPDGSGMVVSQGERSGMKGKPFFLVLLCVLCASAVRAQTHLVIVSGLGGEKKYTTAFNDLAQKLADAGNKRFGIPESEILWFGEDSVSRASHFRGQSTK